MENSQDYFSPTIYKICGFLLGLIFVVSIGLFIKKWEYSGPETAAISGILLLLILSPPIMMSILYLLFGFGKLQINNKSDWSIKLLATGALFIITSSIILSPFISSENSLHFMFPLGVFLIIISFILCVVAATPHKDQ